MTAFVTPQRKLTAKSWLAVFALALFWGSGFFTVDIALRELGVFNTVLYRIGIAALILWVVAVVRKEPIVLSWRLAGLFLVMGILNNAIPFIFMVWAQTEIDSSLVAIINSTAALFGVIVGSMAFHDEKLTKRRLIGVLIGIGGVVIIVGPDALLNFSIKSIAQMAVLCGTFSYALAAVWARVFLHGFSPVLSSAYMLTGSSLFVLVLAILFEGGIQTNVSWTTLTAVSYYAIFGTAISFLLYFWLVHKAGTGNTLLVTLLVPPIAIVIGVFILHEQLTIQAILGMIVIAIGLLIVDSRLYRKLPLLPRKIKSALRKTTLSKAL